MTKQEIQTQIKDAVLDSEIFETNIIANLELNKFADEPEFIQILIALIDIKEWIEEQGLLINTIDQFDPEQGHYQITELTPIDEFDITDKIVKQYISKTDKFRIL